ncbi:hypothetical protein A2296_02510 [candidate division CPR3 bacterium RIFOXYB2_FULL_35_8]|nr:MAG: hypothetical protein A2250_00390 [candidate division CPR3 bacterium RIFOXYA2_FULL_35_13]OGB78652.1 MAG: hypothetical protein A2296_02510 [candidate division CPR3 bacterium RIFOXYB2_FULL_35_8]
MIFPIRELKSPFYSKTERRRSRDKVNFASFQISTLKNFVHSVRKETTVAGKLPDQSLYGFLPESGQLSLGPLSVIQGIHYSRCVWGGLTLVPLDSTWTRFNILDVVAPDDHLMRPFWHPIIQDLGVSGHLLRFCDSMLKMGMVIDPRYTGIDIDYHNPEYWLQMIYFIKDLIEKMIKANKENLLNLKNTSWDRVYIRPMALCQAQGIGPVQPDIAHPTMADLYLIAQAFADYGKRDAVLVRAPRALATITGTIKMSGNYGSYLTLKKIALDAAKLVGIEADDCYQVKYDINGRLVLGEASTCALGTVFQRKSGPKLIVPDPLSTDTLPSFTARWVIRLAQEQLGINAGYGAIPIRQFEEEVLELMRCGNATRVKPVSAIGRRPLVTEIGNQISVLYEKVVRGELYPEHSTVIQI